MDKIILFTLSTCPTCEKARTLLIERGVRFEERVIDDRADWQDEVISLSGQYTVPVQLHPDGRVEVGIDGEHG